MNVMKLGMANARRILLDDYLVRAGLGQLNIVNTQALGPIEHDNFGGRRHTESPVTAG